MPPGPDRPARLDRPARPGRLDRLGRLGTLLGGGPHPGVPVPPEGEAPVGPVLVVAVAEPGQVVEGGGAALGEVGHPVVVLEAQPGVTARDHAPRVPQQQGRPDPAGDVASGRVHRGDVGAVGHQQFDQGVAQQRSGVVDGDRAHAGDLTAPAARHLAPTQGREVDHHRDRGLGVRGAPGGGPGPVAPRTEDALTGDQGHQGVGPVGVGGLQAPVPPGPLELAVGLGPEGGLKPGPGPGGEPGVQAERPVPVGPGPGRALVVEAPVVAGLVLARAPLGLGPKAPLLERGVGVGPGRVDQVVLSGRIDLGGLGHLGGPPAGEPAGPERLVQSGPVGQLAAQPEQAPGVAHRVPGRRGQQLGRRAVAGQPMDVGLLHPTGGQGLAGRGGPLHGGEQADQGDRVVPRVPLGLQGGHEAGQDPAGRLGVGEGGWGVGLGGGHGHGDSEPGGCDRRPGPPSEEPGRPRRGGGSIAMIAASLGATAARPAPRSSEHRPDPADRALGPDRGPVRRSGHRRTRVRCRGRRSGRPT